MPSDLTEAGSGPILLATDVSPASGDAATLVKTLSEDLGRELEVAHARESSDYLDIYLSLVDHKMVDDQAEEHNQGRMSEWLEAHNLTGVTPRVLEGANVVTTLHDHAEKVSAATVVVGSRQLSVVDRIFDSSVASHLAAHAPTAVLVVPPAQEVETRSRSRWVARLREPAIEDDTRHEVAGDVDDGSCHIVPYRAVGRRPTGAQHRLQGFQRRRGCRTE